MKRGLLVPPVRRALRAAPVRGARLVLGLSGGPDSVALLDVLLELASGEGFSLVVAHLDHGLREGSADDRAFCEELARERGLPFRAGRAEVRARAARDHGGVEEAARRERYAFLRAVREDTGARFVVTAHTRDDQAETVLLRLMRGAGTEGLQAMRPLSGDLLRPLLLVGRQDVLAHLEDRGLPYREDPSNADPAFLRNRVRRELLPYLESRFNPRVREGLARTAAVLADEDAFLAESARKALEAIRVPGGLSRARILREPAALARRVLRLALQEAGGLRGVGAVHVQKVLDLARSREASGKSLPLPGGREARIHFDLIAIRRVRTSLAPFALTLPVPGRVVTPSGLAFSAEPETGSPVSKPEEATVSAPEGEDLVVRPLRPGDQVLVRGRLRRARRYLMERRVPREVRDCVPVVAAGARVLFVPGAVLEGDAPSGGRRVRIEVLAP
jgi:tRNA(Ile)-lysidine synthase